MKQPFIKKFAWGFLPPFIFFVIIFFGLELAVHVFNIQPTTLPAPFMIVSQTVENFVVDIWPHFLSTLKILFGGYFVGVPLGMLFAIILSQFKLLVKAFNPLIVILVVTPMMVLVPLMMMWFGYDENLRIILVSIQCMPIITLNVLAGFTNVEKDKFELAKSYGASKTKTFIKIIFPSALPRVFSGLKLGCIVATLGAVSTEFVAGKIGLGYRLVYYCSFLEIGLAFGCIIIVALTSRTLLSIVGFIQRKVVVWQDTGGF